MRSHGAVAGVLGLVIGCFPLWVAGAQSSASHTVTIRFVAVNHAVVMPAPVLQTSNRSGVSTGVGSYGFATTERGQKIVVDLDRPLPTGSTLALRMTAPREAMTTGTTVVRTAPVDLVTEIRPVQAAAELPIAFTLSSTRPLDDAGAPRCLTYTIIAGS